MKYKNIETNEVIEAKNFAEEFAYSNNSEWEKVASKKNNTKTLKKE